ncbi:MAG: ATP-grasp domain-containing protein [Candidatus Heimdallarchaeota archaeon]
MAVLITDGNYKNALAILRALATNDVEVYCSSTKKKSVSFYSKYCKKHFIYSNPASQPEKFKKEMLSIVKNYDIDVLIPVGVSTTALISHQKSDLEKYTHVPVADYQDFAKAHDKQIANDIARDNKVPVPLTYTPTTESELKKHLKELGLPVMLKARKGCGIFSSARTKSEAFKIWRNYEKKSKETKSIGITDYLPVVQEYLPGEIIDVLFVFNKGQVRGLLTQRRFLTLPPEGGVGALNITVNDPQTARHAANLMKALNWHGVGMAEFKRDVNGVPKLIEINPKFWGTSEVSIAAEMNFPYMLYKLAMDGDIKPKFSFLYPKRFGWPVPMGVKQIMESDTPIESLKEYLKLFTEANSHDIRLLSDPKPFSFQLYQTAKVILNKILQSRSKRIDLDSFR